MNIKPGESVEDAAGRVEKDRQAEGRLGKDEAEDAAGSKEDSARSIEKKGVMR